MARTFTDAFAEVASPDFDRATGYEIERPTQAPASPEVREAWAGFEYRELAHVVRVIAISGSGSDQDAEDAVHDVIVQLLETKPHVFRENPREVLGMIAGYARNRLRQIREKHRNEGMPLSLDVILHLGGTEESPLDTATAMVAHGRVGVDEDARYTPPPAPGEDWNRGQLVGAVQRFRDQYGRSPRTGEFHPEFGLPNRAVIPRLGFTGIEDLLLEAGVPVEVVPKSRARWSAVESAEACYAVRRRQGYWPSASDIPFHPPGTLPPTSAMKRFFGGCTSSAIQLGCEAILGPIDLPEGGGLMVAFPGSSRSRRAGAERVAA